MPLTNLTTYIPTMSQFIAHWTQVNATLDTPLIVTMPDKSSMTLLQFTALRDSLRDEFEDVIDRMNDVEIARGDILLQKPVLLAYLNEFNGLLDGHYASTPFINARPYAPSTTSGEEHFIAPMRDIYSLWTKLNNAGAPAGVTLPLELADGTTADEFRDAYRPLSGAYITEAEATQNAGLARSRRDGIMEKARAAMVCYRKLVPSRCVLFPELVETLPRLSPHPGHTPEPVNASAVFVEPDQARVVYEESGEATLLRYELRGNPGPEYLEEDAVVIATNTPEDPREFLTGFALTQPGTRASFKVYVILTTFNEAGSAEMTVERPLE